ncbi:MAG: hypothetical protein EOP14_03730 [Pseudomonas sp.]|nr:MAG: hypothetical protein EOP14_03730 [Pseudomonas sp.]
MNYEFLYHLTQATLSVVIYDQRLVEALSTYELQRLLIVARPKSSWCFQLNVEKSVQVVKITRAGRRAVHQHLKACKCLGEKAASV